MTAAIRFVIGAALAVLLSALFPVDVHAQPASDERVAACGPTTACGGQNVSGQSRCRRASTSPSSTWAWARRRRPRRATSC